MDLHTPVLPPWRQLRAQGLVSPDQLLSLFGIYSPPVNVEELAQRLGVLIHYVPSPGWLGAVSSTDSRAEMWISQDDRTVRRRFTVAHELGHLFRHSLGVAYRDSNYEPGTSLIEKEANQFAADLLMPAWMMSSAMHSMGGDLRRMARLFDVSEQAMSIRMRNLGIR